MTRPRGWCWCLGSLLLVGAGPANAFTEPLRRPDIVEEIPNHRAIPAPDVDPALLIQRWKELQGQSQARTGLLDLFKKLQRDPNLLNRDPDARQKLDALIKQSGVKVNPNDPLFQNLERWLKNHPIRAGNQPLTPEAQEEWKKLLETLQKMRAQDTSDPVRPPINTGNTALPPAVPPPNPTPPTTPTPEETEARLRFTRWLAEQAQRLNNSQFRDSEMGKQIRRDLERFATSDAFKGARRWGNDSQLGKRFAELSKEVRSTKLLSNVNLPLPKLNLPMPNWKGMPQVGTIGRPPSLGSLPSFGAPSLPTRPPSGEGLLWLMALGGVLLVAWRLWKIYGPVERKQPVLRLEDLQWPTRLETLRTREDLVRAFEQISLVKLGEDARHWNHLELAAGLGIAVPNGQDAAQRLALLYEQARYAPDDEPLPADALNTARQSLALLAGGAA